MIMMSRLRLMGSNLQVSCTCVKSHRDCFGLSSRRHHFTVSHIFSFVGLISRMLEIVTTSSHQANRWFMS